MWKNITIGVLAIAVVYLLFSPQKIERKVMPAAAEILVDAEVKRVNNKIDEKGFNHAVIEEVENIVGSHSMVKDTASKQLDSVVKILKIEREQLKEWRQYAVTWRDSFMVARRVNDTLFQYSNNYGKWQFITRKDSAKGSYFNYEYNADISHAEYWEKENLLSSKKHFIDFWVNDPKATINGVKRIKIMPKEPPRIDINAMALYNHGLKTGFEGSFQKGRIRIGGGALYDINKNEWQPVISTRFSILQF